MCEDQLFNQRQAARWFNQMVLVAKVWLQAILEISMHRTHPAMKLVYHFYETIPTIANRIKYVYYIGTGIRYHFTKKLNLSKIAPMISVEDLSGPGT